MKGLRVWSLTFFGWLFVFYNIERLLGPANLVPAIYLVAPLSALPLMMFPRLHVSIPWLTVLPIVIVVSLRLWLEYPISGASLPLTLMEIGCVGLTAALARQVGQNLEDLRRSAVTALLDHGRDRSRSFEDGQEAIDREIRRARTFRRDLSLLAISAGDETIGVSFDRFTQEVQRDTVHKYAMVRTAELLSTEMKSSDIITRSDGHFVTVLPETSRAGATRLIEKLKRSAREKLGLELTVGLSVFPEEETTFVKLLERAENDMGNSRPDTPAHARGLVRAAPVRGTVGRSLTG